MKAKAKVSAGLHEAMIACGITKKGEPLARVVWEAAEKIFAAAEPGNPFEVAEFAYVLLKCKAADLDIARRRQKGAS